MYRTGMVDRKRMSKSIPRQKLFDLEALKTLASGTLQHITAQHWKYMDVWSRRILMPGRLGAKKEPILERTELLSPWSFTPQGHQASVYLPRVCLPKAEMCCHFQSHKPFTLINLIYFHLLHTFYHLSDYFRYCIYVFHRNYVDHSPYPLTTGKFKQQTKQYIAFILLLSSTSKNSLLYLNVHIID